MPEPTKTLLFVGAAVLSVALAIFSRPSTSDYDPSDQIGRDLAQPFGPEEAKRLSITRFDEETATISTFEVAERDGVWSLPSKGGYPADAVKQLAEAIEGITDREILQVASEDARNHAEYGVIDPASPKLEPGQTGVGTRVALAKDSGDKLVDIIIGKEVKDAEEQRYVRRAEQDVVFITKIDPASFSTDFSEWIEDDLLKLSAWDIRRVRINDYSSELFYTLQGLEADRDYRSEITLAYDDGESKWSLEGLAVAEDPDQPVFTPAEMGENEELNEDNLRELKNSLDDLRIVDVRRKPEGMSADLRSGEDFLNDPETMNSLVKLGFAPSQKQDGSLELLCSEGEVICTMKDGVEYVLRFGNLKLDEGEEPAPAAEAEDGEESEASGVNRYLFVMARFNEEIIEKPELEAVPDLPEGAEAAEEASEEAAADEEPAEGATEEGDEGDSEQTDAQEADAEEDDAEEGDKEGDEPSELEKAVAERKAIEERNARLLDEYEEKLKTGREHVVELNDRFGDWYYVVSDEVFKKVRLGKAEVIKEKEAEEEAEGDSPAGGAPNASAFGVPGAAVPGLPGMGAALGGAADPDQEEPAAEEPAAEEAAAEDEAMTEDSAETTEAEQSEVELAEEAPSEE